MAFRKSRTIRGPACPKPPCTNVRERMLAAIKRCTSGKGCQDLQDLIRKADDTTAASAAKLKHTIAPPRK